METLRIKKLSPNGKLTKGFEEDAGYDLYSMIDLSMVPDNIYEIPTGISVEIPKGNYGRIAEKSSLAKKGIKISGGVVDSNYRGEIICLVYVLNPYIISKGDKIAQLIIEKITLTKIEEVEALETTDRGDKGFGSTGL